MKQWLRRVAIAVASLLTMGLSGIAWYGFSTPTLDRLSLSHTLIDATSIEGKHLLATASARADFDQLAPYFVQQSRRAFCGVASATIVINAILHPQPPVTQSTLFTPAASAVRSEIAVSFAGLTLEQLAEIIKVHGLQVRTIHAVQSNVESFRNMARATLSEPSEFLIVNFDRTTLEEEGMGHISPVGAYSAETDRLLVMDVAATKYPYTWIPVQELWNAMNTVDPDSRQTRGFLLVRASGTQPIIPQNAEQ
ncbi:phytochelatin synthase family protein [Pseudomonas sp. GL-R-26]|uniref:phytochelatin synthase family protein n=1 Tax=Pseudomonas sp. GL-R-26 TaxID=2832392 RepID=UPI001CBE5EA7|nr:phytochelatin synthase family protein [Pseudomonas sp. GL-R-26]